MDIETKANFKYDGKITIVMNIYADIVSSDVSGAKEDLTNYIKNTHVNSSSSSDSVSSTFQSVIFNDDFEGKVTASIDGTEVKTENEAKCIHKITTDYSEHEEYLKLFNKGKKSEVWGIVLEDQDAFIDIIYALRTAECQFHLKDLETIVFSEAD